MQVFKRTFGHRFAESCYAQISANSMARANSAHANSMARAAVWRRRYAESNAKGFAAVAQYERERAVSEIACAVLCRNDDRLLR